MFHHQAKNPTVEQLQLQLNAVKRRDPKVLAILSAECGGELSSMSEEDKLRFLQAKLEASLRFVNDEPHTVGEIFHSRDPIGGLIQSAMNDNVVAEIQGTGEGNAVVWIPAGIKGILEHVQGKYPFKVASDLSRIKIPANCKVALLADWGADNEHAKRIGDLAMSHGAEYVIHLGDIYYSGSKSECETFVKNWPLKDGQGNPLVGKSFALNGNHEMYSLGNNYFTTVLEAFKQEASYFTLYNDWWQIQGLDTAYVPFTIDGDGEDDRLKAQWEWLSNSIDRNPEKKNIFVSHNQPVSSHLPEFEAAQKLQNQWWKLATGRSDKFAHAWFFGHEHRCTIYNDIQVDKYKARLIGSGSIPHHPQTESAAATASNGAKADAIWRVNHGVLADGAIAVSTFALLSFDRNKCIVEYIDETGKTFYREDLTGGPNCALDGL